MAVPDVLLLNISSYRPTMHVELSCSKLTAPVSVCTMHGRPSTLFAIWPGYEHPVDSVVDDLLACLDDPWLPLLQWSELYAVAQSRLPSDLAARLEQIVGEAAVSRRAQDRSHAVVHGAACQPRRSDKTKLRVPSWRDEFGIV